MTSNGRTQGQKRETMTIARLLRQADGSPCPGIIALPAHLADCAVTHIAHDSRLVRPGSLFFALVGQQSDGHDFAAKALAAGAVAVVAQKPLPLNGLPPHDSSLDKLILVDDSRIALACAAASFYGNPGAELAITGITGTNGKTTTIYLLDAIARAAGEQSAVIGTVESRYLLSADADAAECVQSCETTTPDALQLQELLAQMRDAGVQSVAMEVSSHAIDLHRVEQTPFAAVAFTNLSQDHLDYHHSMEAYRQVKERLFFDFETSARIVNTDDSTGAGLAEKLRATATAVITVGICQSTASDCKSCTSSNNCSKDIAASDLVLGTASSQFSLHTPDGSAQINFPLVGRYNVENALLAAACAWSRGISLSAIADGLSRAPQVPGRLEQVQGEQDFSVFVDYAHTPDALATALAALREQSSGRLITVFGCGGDRDASKRPLMGQAAAVGSDYVVVTSDNPRSEDPAGIVADICKGLPADFSSSARKANLATIIDRREAIFHAVKQARSGDCILIAGKGHEDYQIFADGTIAFDDREVAREALLQRKGEQEAQNHKTQGHSNV